MASSAKWRTLQVHRECLASFTALGITETRDRTGILIYLSELERRVEILADRGIHKHTGEGYWTEQVDHIVAGIREARAGEALCQSIGKIGEKLAAHFPPRADDKDELSNRVLVSGEEKPNL